MNLGKDCNQNNRCCNYGFNHNSPIRWRPPRFRTLNHFANSMTKFSKNKKNDNLRKKIVVLFGTPMGIRTPDTAVRGRRPRPLDYEGTFNAQ